MNKNESVKCVKCGQEFFDAVNMLCIGTFQTCARCTDRSKQYIFEEDCNDCLDSQRGICKKHLVEMKNWDAKDRLREFLKRNLNVPCQEEVLEDDFKTHDCEESK